MNNNCNSAATDFFCYAMRYDSVCTADYDTAPVIRAKLIPAGVCALVTSASSVCGLVNHNPACQRQLTTPRQALLFAVLNNRRMPVLHCRVYHGIGESLQKGVELGRT
jgi:hypothetical protein